MHTLKLPHKIHGNFQNITKLHLFTRSFSIKFFQKITQYRKIIGKKINLPDCTFLFARTKKKNR